MKTRKLFWALVPVFALFAVSCNPDDKKGKEPDVPVDESRIIASIQYDDNLYGGDYTAFFYYDEKGRVVKIEDENEYGKATVTVTYSENEVRVSEKGENYPSTGLIYELDASGKALSMVAIFDDEINVGSKFLYNTDGTMSSFCVEPYNYEEGEFGDVPELSINVEYKWKDGNLVTALASIMGYDFERGDRTYSDIPNDTNLDLNSLICLSDFSYDVTNTDYDGELFGIYGKRSDNMLSSDIWDKEEICKYEYELDDQERIVKIEVYSSYSDAETELEGTYYINYMK
ncbi:MAG: hypothetical protein IAB93_00020 [Bacteroidetes bacterium]|uniref:DUF4595 domain-containing protein n=1 Tax=Candidatus Merdivivens pullistercoris TaxID=2840873 RepID=A0A9D9I3H1_9BACT|nr:hypothetical protein [Candidatus Merdivivens pullistercoris]